MSEDIKMTKLASCAGCGAKVGAGVLVKLLNNLPVHSDPRLIVGYDKSDDASVYVINEETAIVQTIDFFPPIVDDPWLFGQIAACNALSDVYAMGGEPKLAMNVMTISKEMTKEAVHEVLRGGYEKAYEAGTIITGGHTIEDIDRILFTYYRHKPTHKQKRHFYAYIAITGWFYMHWTMLKESKGQKVGIHKTWWYTYARDFSKLALEMYNEK